MPGIDSTGFTVKTLEEIEDDLKAGYRGVFGAGIDLEPESIDGMMIAIQAERLSEVWSAMGAVYQAAFPDGADGVNQDNVCSITGVVRLPATYSKVDVTCSGIPGTVIGAGKILSVLNVPTSKFANLLPGTIGGGGTVVIEFRALVTGPVVAPAGTLTVIESPVSGWESATNPLDQKLKGTNQELDPALRLRRESSLRALGNASTAAIRSKVLAVTNVTEAFVFENTTALTDSNGLPPNFVEVVAVGGTDAAVAQAIYDAKAGGIGTHGTSSQAVIDSSGFDQLVKFSRPANVNIYQTWHVTVANGAFPSNGIARIKQAAVDWATLHMHTGNPVVSSAFLRDVLDDIPGILDVALPLIKTSATPTDPTTIVMTNRQKAAFDTSRILVSVNGATPA